MSIDDANAQQDSSITQSETPTNNGNSNTSHTPLEHTLRNPFSKLIIPSIFCGIKGFIIATLGIIDLFFCIAKIAITYPLYYTFPSLIPVDRKLKTPSFEQYHATVKDRVKRDANAIWQNKIPFLEMIICIMVPITICILIKKGIIPLKHSLHSPVIALCMVSGFLAMFATCLILRLGYLIFADRERRCGTRVLGSPVLFRGIDHINFLSPDEISRLDDGQDIYAFCPPTCLCSGCKELDPNALTDEEQPSRFGAFLDACGTLLSTPKYIIDCVLLTTLGTIFTVESSLYSLCPPKILRNEEGNGNDYSHNPAHAEALHATQTFSAASAMCIKALTTPLGPIYALISPVTKPYDVAFDVAEKTSTMGEAKSGCCI